MKRRILLLLVALVAIPAIALGGMTVVKKKSAADSCTGSLIHSWHAENVDVTLGTPAGCSTTDTTADAASAVELSSTQAKDGTYSVHPTSTLDNYYFSVPGTLDAAGRIEMWVYAASGTSELAVPVYADSSNYIWLYKQSNDTVRIYWLASGQSAVTCTTTDTVAANTWTFVSASWSVAGESGNYLRIGINTTGDAPTYVNCTTGIVDLGTASVIKIGDGLGNSSVFPYIDNIKVYNAW